MSSSTSTFTRQWPQAAPRPAHHLPGRPKFHERFSIATVEDASEWGLYPREQPMTMRAELQQAQTTNRSMTTDTHQSCVPHVSSFFTALFTYPNSSQQPEPRPTPPAKYDKPLPPLPQETTETFPSPKSPSHPPSALVRQERMTRAQGARIRDARFSKTNRHIPQSCPLVRQHHVPRLQLAQAAEETLFKDALACDLSHRPGGEADSYYRDHPLQTRQDMVSVPLQQEVESVDVRPVSCEGMRSLSFESSRCVSPNHSTFQSLTSTIEAGDDMNSPSYPPRIPSLAFSDLSLHFRSSDGYDSDDNVQETRRADRRFSLGEFSDEEGGSEDGEAADTWVSGW
ncbi:hypothetical protein J1614_006863 [Plenodomus biglobosus]|nr:hypothetical protein J1614_006863 [Plenodomus biglobosus]